MEFPQQIKNGIAFWPSDSLLGLYSKNPETPVQKNLSTPMFIAALFTIAKCWKQPKCSSINDGSKNCGTFTQWTATQQKERTPAFCNSMDGTREYYAKWNKPVSKRQIAYDLTYKKNLMNKIN